MRKVLSFVLVLALVLSSFSMAFAADATAAGLSDIDGIANEEAVIVANDLGIVTGNPDGTFQPEKAVNRAEFAAMITRALGVPETALAGYTATSFKDTAGYGWAVPYLAFCESKGIMLGDGAGNAMPGKTITVNEAMTMVLRAIGYTSNSAELVGVWPSNYVTKAQDLSLYDDVATIATVDKANAAQIIYNALTKGKVQVSSDGTTTEVGSWDVSQNPRVWDPATMLTTGLNCEVCDADIITGEEDSLINLSKYVGAYAIAYENDDDEIVAMGEVKSTFLTGDFDVTDHEFEANDVTYKLPATTQVVSGGGATFVNNSNQNTAAAVPGVDADDITIAVELNGKTVKTLYSVLTWDVAIGADAKVDAADIEGIEADQEFLGVDFVLDDDDNIDYDTFSLVGVKSLKEIKEDNVVYVFAYDATHENHGKIAKIAVGTEVVEGDITDYDTDTNQLAATYTVNAKDYEFQTSYNVTPELDTLTGTNNGVGDTFKFFLDFQGRIYEAEEVESTPDNYGVVTYYAGAGIDDAKVKIYTSADSEKTILVDSDTDNDLEAAPLSFSDGNIPRVLIGYSLDKDGVIDGVDTTVALAPAGSTVGTKVFTVSGGAAYNILSSTVVFTWDGADLDMAKMGDLEDTLDSAATYIVDDKDLVAILVAETDAGASADDTFGVFNKTVITYDSVQDENVNKVTGFENGVAFTKNANDDDVVTASAITVGDLYKIEFDADGYIKEITLVFDGGDSEKWAIQGDIATTTIAALDQNKTVITLSDDANAAFELADDVVVYQYDADAKAGEEYSVSKVSSLRAGYKAVLFNTTADDDTEYDVVIFQK